MNPPGDDDAMAGSAGEVLKVAASDPAPGVVGHAARLLAIAFLLLWILLGVPAGLAQGPVAGLVLGALAASFWLVLIGTVRLTWFRQAAIRAWLRDRGRAPGEARSVVLIGGRIRCAGSPVEAPLTGRQGVGWEVSLRGPSRLVPGEAFEWSGAGQAACLVDTGTDTIPIRAGLLLDDCTWTKLRKSDVGERLERWLALTEFAEIDGKGGARRMLTTLDHALAAADGFRWDVRRRVDPHRTRRDLPKERVLETGQVVTLIGPYQPEQGLLHPLELFVQSPEVVARGLIIEVATAVGFTLCFSLTQLLYAWAVLN